MLNTYYPSRSLPPQAETFSVEISNATKSKVGTMLGRDSTFGELYCLCQEGGGFPLLSDPFGGFPLLSTPLGGGLGGFPLLSK